MKYTGRILALFIVVFGAVGWSIFDYCMNGSYKGGWKRFFIVLIVTLFYMVGGWWAGKQYDKAKFYSEKDDLTAVYNRRFVYNIFPKLLKRVDITKSKLTVFVIDINDFKVLNDTYGHETGDAVIQSISNSLLKHTRKTDVVARWGGDEFVVLALYTDEIYPVVLLERIEKDLEQLSKKLRRNISVSVGKAVYPDEAKDLDSLIRIADNNMYISKREMKKSEQ
jgi:diguanylate cyclase (GGDEF)-like protein